jgi:sRNA-binding protein
MTIALDHSKLGPNGRPLLGIKSKTPEAAPEPTTAKPLNKKQRQAIAREKALDWLRSQFPGAFNFHYQPLATDTRQRVVAAAQEAGRDIKAVDGAIRLHTSHTRYLFQLSQPEAIRIDLSGNPVEPVSEDHRLFAAKQLSAARVRIAELKRQERLAKRNAKQSQRY